MKFAVTRQVPISGEVSIAAVQSTDPTPGNSLLVASYHTDYPANVENVPQGTGSIGGGGLASNTLPMAMIGYPNSDGPRNYQSIVTDKVLHDEEVSRDTHLLPYEYQLRYDHWAYTTNPSGSVEVVYESGDEVPGAKFELEFNDPPMWVDYEANGASMTHRYDRSLTWSNIPAGTGAIRTRLLLGEDLAYTDNTYYVKYNKALSGGGGIINERDDITDGHMEIINPEIIYQYGQDYTYDVGSATIQIIDGGLLPYADGDGTYVKRSKLNRIKVLPPRSHTREGWFAKVWAGSFKDADGNVYYVPETIAKQPAAVDWSSVGDAVIAPRCTLTSYDEVGRRDSHTILTNDYPLYFTTSNYPNYIPNVIYDGYHNALGDVDSNADSNKGINLYINDTLMNGSAMAGTGGIVDWDAWNGVLKLQTPIVPQDEVRVTYLHQQLYYNLQVPDLNPQVHHTKPGPSGQSISGYVGREDSVVIALLPSGSETNTDECLLWYHRSINPSGIYNSTEYGYSTVMGGTTYAMNPDVTAVAGTITLGEVSVYGGTPSVYDTRLRGGGIIEDSEFIVRRREHTPRVEIQEESNYYNDIGLYDGQGLKKDGILIIKIPLTKLDELRGNIVAEGYQISEEDAHMQAVEEVRNIVESNIGMGTYYVIVDSSNIPWPTELPRRS